ncbi:hypothetical protein LIER_31566 [Lithospermum erythrorhizon]|uniref:Gag-pol polyprotein n=1 Tax=Lithospermum erythrorhizon TaxID=34254 RepID=A0AAV3RRD5_LITER
MKSTSSECFFLGNNLVSWFIKNQNYVSLSTAEAEYIATGSSCTQLLWMKQDLGKVLHVLGSDQELTLRSDELMSGKHIVDVPLNAPDQPEGTPEGEATKIQALKATIPPVVNDFATTSTVVPADPTPDATKTSKFPV